MNLADFTSFLIVTTAFICPVVVCSECNAPWWLYIPCGIIGIVIGFLIAIGVSRLAYQMLKNRTNKFIDVISYIGYLLHPIVSLALTFTISAYLWAFTLDQLGYPIPDAISELGGALNQITRP